LQASQRREYSSDFFTAIALFNLHSCFIHCCGQTVLHSIALFPLATHSSNSEHLNFHCFPIL
jgi:hypothetical protein